MLFLQNNKVINLGNKLGHGGEGKVFDILELPDSVAKIYHNPIDNKKAAKIKVMSNMSYDELLSIAAWPTDLVYKQNSDRPVGFVMPKILGYKDIHCLFSPKTRKAEFPNTDWQFLIHSAENLARAFATIHEKRQIIGDINQKNIQVSSEGMIKFIDCDSFQIFHNGNYHFCDVGVETHQPPEVQDLPSFKNLKRTDSHDLFGLAVLIFQLLFMGRHPYSGRFLGDGYMPINKAIKEYRFAYGRNARQKRMEQPPNTLSLEYLPQGLINLFESAFVEQGISRRPKAIEWIQQLSELRTNLKKCKINDGHVYPKMAKQCPWCEIEANARIVLFYIRRTTDGQYSSNQIEKIWAVICAIKSPNSLPDFPNYLDVKLKPTVKEKNSAKGFTGLIAFLQITFLIAAGSFSLYYTFSSKCGTCGYVFTLFIIAFFYSLFFSKEDPAKSQINSLQKEFNEENGKNNIFQNEWNNESTNNEFQRKLNELKEYKNQYERLHELRSEKVNRLYLMKKDIQLEEYLIKFLIDNYHIHNIGPVRKATLNSYGISTAADIFAEDILEIPGFGQKYTSNLLQWRAELESGFIFNPNRSIDEKYFDEIEIEMEKMKSDILNKLSEGEKELKILARKITRKREELIKEANNQANVLAQLHINIQHLQK